MRSHLVPSDVNMPGVDGFEFLAQMKADPTLRRVPFMFASVTCRDEGARCRAKAEGADFFLLRPGSAEELLKQVEALLSRKEGADGDNPGR